MPLVISLSHYFFNIERAAGHSSALVTPQDLVYRFLVTAVTNYHTLEKYKFTVLKFHWSECDIPWAMNMKVLRGCVSFSRL